MYDGRAAYHVRRFPRPSPSVFEYWKRSKAGGVEGLGTRLVKGTIIQLIGAQVAIEVKRKFKPANGNKSVKWGMCSVGM